MEMDKKVREILILLIFLLNYLLVASNVKIGFILNFFGSTTVPLILNVFPGYLWYRYERDNKPSD